MTKKSMLIRDSRSGPQSSPQTSLFSDPAHLCPDDAKVRDKIMPDGLDSVFLSDVPNQANVLLYLSIARSTMSFMPLLPSILSPPSSSPSYPTAHMLSGPNPAPSGLIGPVPRTLLHHNRRKPQRGRRGTLSLGHAGDGSGAVLSAASTLGLLRGLNTVAQLWYYYRCADGIGGSDYARGEGEDAPHVDVGACDYVRRGSDYLRPVESWTDLGNGDSHIAGSCSTPRETCTSSHFSRRDELTCLPCSRFSFPLPDIERTLDAMS
jgi:hypothetical protein